MQYICIAFLLLICGFILWRSHKHLFKTLVVLMLQSVIEVLISCLSMPKAIVFLFISKVIFKFIETKEKASTPRGRSWSPDVKALKQTSGKFIKKSGTLLDKDNNIILQNVKNIRQYLFDKIQKTVNTLFWVSMSIIAIAWLIDIHYSNIM